MKRNENISNGFLGEKRCVNKNCNYYKGIVLYAWGIRKNNGSLNVQK